MSDAAERRAGVVVREQRFAEMRQPRPGIERTERLTGEKVGIVRRNLEADVEGLLHVGSPSGIERFVQHSGIATIPADGLDRQRLPLGQRQREEAARLIERRGDQARVDGVVDNIEKADVPAGGAGFGRDSCQRRAIALTPG
jgi:hypothetical protein